MICHIRGGSVLAAVLLLAGGAAALLMPDEAARHTRTYMALPTNATLWGAAALPLVQRALVDVANRIARHEHVVLYVAARDNDAARRMINHTAVAVFPFPVDDLWMRDTACVFAYDCANRSDCARRYGPADAAAFPAAPLRCVDFNFNGWGGKQAHANDARVARSVAAYAGVAVVSTKLTMEGGAVEVDGDGTALLTESSVINANRNPGWSKADVEAALYTTLGIEKVIWTPGAKGRDITDAHIDFYARFAAPGVVVAARENDAALFDYNVTRRVIRDLRDATDARGRRLAVHVIDNPDALRPAWASPDFAASYINYYVGNGVVVAPQFGDAAADGRARATLQQLYPARAVEMLNVDAIAFGGGGIHCATQQQPVGTLPVATSAAPVTEMPLGPPVWTTTTTAAPRTTTGSPVGPSTTSPTSAPPTAASPPDTAPLAASPPSSAAGPDVVTIVAIAVCAAVGTAVAAAAVLWVVRSRRAPRLDGSEAGQDGGAMQLSLIVQTGTEEA
jgi:agmatine deiminase